MAKTITPPTTENTVKVSGDIVEKVRNLVTLRAEIARLEKEKDSLTEEIKEAFGEGTTLIHRNIEIARLSMRSRQSTDEKALQELFPEAFEATRKVTTYPVITALHKEGN